MRRLTQLMKIQTRLALTLCLAFSAVAASRGSQAPRVEGPRSFPVSQVLAGSNDVMTVSLTSIPHE